RVFGVLESLMRAAIGRGALTVAALASVTSLSTTLVLGGALKRIGLLGAGVLGRRSAADRAAGCLARPRPGRPAGGGGPRPHPAAALGRAVLVPAAGRGGAGGPPPAAGTTRGPRCAGAAE